MSTTEVREAIAEALREALPEGWAVYAKPPRAMAAPSAVVGPRSPYRTMETFTQERVGLRVSLLMPGTSDLDDLDQILDLAWDALWEVDTVGIDSVTDVGTLQDQETGPSYLSAAIDLWVI